MLILPISSMQVNCSQIFESNKNNTGAIITLYRQKITANQLKCSIYNLSSNDNKEEPCLIHCLSFEHCPSCACLQKLFEISFNIYLITVGAIIASFF